MASIPEKLKKGEIDFIIGICYNAFGCWGSLWHFICRPIDVHFFDILFIGIVIKIAFYKHNWCAFVATTTCEVS